MGFFRKFFKKGFLVFLVEEKVVSESQAYFSGFFGTEKKRQCLKLASFASLGNLSVVPTWAGPACYIIAHNVTRSVKNLGKIDIFDIFGVNLTHFSNMKFQISLLKSLMETELSCC